MPEFTPTERIGVNAVEKIFLKDFRWMFREQPISDMGIDAHVEISIGGKATGKLVAMQIKTGESHFVMKDDGLIYYGEMKHLEYWINHSLPVLLVAHLPDTEETFWVLVVPKNIQRTKKGWKIKIPRSQVLGENSLNDILKISEGTDEMVRKRKLFIDRPLMDAIRNGNKVSIEFMDWINKSLNRTYIKVIVTQEDVERVERQWGIAYAGYEYEEVMKNLFPWADVSVDEEFYGMNLDEDSIAGMYSLEYIFKKSIYPYNVQSNEVANYRLELHLNELGRGFLSYTDYVDEDLLP